VKIRIEKLFDKDVSKINDKNILQKLRVFISTVDKANDITGVSHVKKLQGYHSFIERVAGGLVSCNFETKRNSLVSEVPF
jgi:hypothetical protein